uniref:Non-specific lipid-transfer protein n=2 Tax=Pinus subgen. Pinus TaxID=139271 RepID=A0A3G1KL27_PINSY|nr:nonspecific lipid transfer protein [Pinus sylvestris]QWM97377.1 non-specific lipid transfer protein [Pinus sylvestris]QWM97378.1 non-specific lipid transfer protein [Pinus sylvestris]
MAVSKKMVEAVFVVGLVVTMMNVWGAVSVEGAISCNQVVSAMTPCATYLLGNAATPAAACCPSIRGLDSQVKATPDRQAVCNCLKTQAQSYGVKLGKAANLPGLCKVTDLNVPISPNVDCSKVH